MRFPVDLSLLLITNKNTAVMRNPFNSKGTAVSVPRREFHTGTGIIGCTLIEANF